jgi:membrane protease YdiL (CAAX protease family)
MEPIESAARVPPRRSYFREVPWRWSDVLVTMAPLILMRLEPFLLTESVRLSLPRWFGLAQAAFDMAWLVVVTLAIARHRLNRWPCIPRPGAVCVEALWAMLATVIVLATLSLLSPLLGRLVGETEMPVNPIEPMARAAGVWERYALLILALLAAPVGEEAVFRGLLYNLLRQRSHLMIAAPLQAVVFGLLHPFDLANSAAVALVGLSLALLYEWRKTLLAPVLLHGLINGVAFLVITLGLTPYANAPALGIAGDAHGDGCLVTTVAPESAADESGLRAGDLITAVDGSAVTDIRGIARIIRKKKAGDTLSVEFSRDGEPQRVDAVLKRRQAGQ